jgi:hypothetical protein
MRRFYWLPPGSTPGLGNCSPWRGITVRLAVEPLFVLAWNRCSAWRGIRNRRPEEHDLRDIGSFKRVEHRIYELAGHQQEIDGHFEFMRVVMGALKIDWPLHTPKIGELSKYWHECSELCHIAWPLSCTVSELRKTAFSALTDIAQSLSAQVSSLGWPVLKDAAFSDLRSRFVAGEAHADDVLAYVRRTGLWARAEFTDGRPPQFVGEPVAPDSSESDT